MSRLSKHTERKDDNWSVGSKKKLVAFTTNKIKKLYVSVLQALDKEFEEGNISEEVRERLRSKTLNVGNAQVRSVSGAIKERYNIEFIPYHIEMPVKPLRRIDEGG